MKTNKLEQMREEARNRLQEIVIFRKGKCLERYVNNRTKLLFKCTKGHEWYSIPTNILRGSWCPNCAGSARITIEEINKIAQSRGGECLSNKYINNKTELLFKCTKGHEWLARPHNIKTSKNWCPECAHNYKKTIENMHHLAHTKKGKCLSNQYINVFTKLDWECAKGHKFSASPDSVKHNHWCPICSTSLAENLCRKHFENIFNKKFPRIRPGWLRVDSGKNLELDGYCEELKLAFEYQGIQHYNSNHYMHKKYYMNTDEGFRKRQKYDLIKRERCKELNIKLIEIPYTIKNNKLFEYILCEVNT